MKGANALNELVNEGWFNRNKLGFCMFAKAPKSRKHMEYFLSLLHTVSTHTVGLNGLDAPISVTRGYGADSLVFKVAS